MLTIVASPKPFQGVNVTIQRNAIGSWLQLPIELEVLLFVDRDTEVPAALGSDGRVQVVPLRRTSPSGAPLLSELIARAEEEAEGELLALVNSDIILLADFTAAIETIRAGDISDWGFVLAGRRHDLNLTEPIDFGDPRWGPRLVDRLVSEGSLAPPPGLTDYLVFRRGVWQDIPPLVYGRAFWDAWLIYAARRRAMPVIDGTSAIRAIHQAHASHVGSVERLRVWDRDLRRNGELAGVAWSYTLYDATHRMERNTILPCTSLRRVLRRMETAPDMPEIHPVVGWLGSVASRLVKWPYRAARWAATSARRQRCRGMLRRLSRGHVLGIIADFGHTNGRPNDPCAHRVAICLARAGRPLVLYDRADPQRQDFPREVLGASVVIVRSSSDLKQCDDVLKSDGTRLASTQGMTDHQKAK